MDRVFCPDCGNEVTSMKGCFKCGKDYYCKDCNKKVTDKKMRQLIKMIKEN